MKQPRTSALTPIDVAIIDGVAAIKMLKPTNTVKTFQGYADLVFIPYVKSQLQHVQRLDIIWDEYRYAPNSLKATTKEKRGLGIRRRVQSWTTVPKNWKEFLRVDENKKELFSFFSRTDSHCRFRQWPEASHYHVVHVGLTLVALLHVTRRKQTPEF